jgi:MOSC domain-containing protein YiiM
MTVACVSIGRPQIMLRDGRRISSAINRRPVEGPTLLTKDGFEGDQVSDQRVHGGPDKAACCFPLEHYAHFSQQLGRELAPPSFGENLTLEGLVEADVCIGDVLQLGAATVQISQPRQPCQKLALKHAAPELPRWIVQTGYTGFYVRVLTPGPVARGDRVTLIQRPNLAITVAHLIRQRYATPPDAVALRRILDSAPQLAPSWRQQLERRIAGDETFAE